MWFIDAARSSVSPSHPPKSPRPKAFNYSGSYLGVRARVSLYSNTNPLFLSDPGYIGDRRQSDTPERSASILVKGPGFEKEGEARLSEKEGLTFTEEFETFLQTRGVKLIDMHLPCDSLSLPKRPPPTLFVRVSIRKLRLLGPITIRLSLEGDDCD